MEEEIIEKKHEIDTLIKKILAKYLKLYKKIDSAYERLNKKL